MKLFKKIVAMSLVATTLLLGACNSNTKNQAVDKKDLQQVNVVLDWYPNAVHSFIYDAIEKGYYEKMGIKVNIIFPANANDAITLTSVGKADIGFYYPQDVIQAKVEQNVPVKIIGSVLQSPVNIVLSLKEKNITSPKDFEGKTIGYAGTALNEAMIKSMMKSQNVDSSKVKFQDVGFDLMSSMTTKKVDATIGCYINHEVPQLEKEGFKLNYFTVDKFGIPTFPDLILVTSDKAIQEKKQVLQNFIKASQMGFEDMKKNPNETLEILLKNQNKENFPLDKDVETKSINILIPIMETKDAKFLSMNKSDLLNTIKWMKDEKIIKNEVAVDDVYQDILK